MPLVRQPVPCPTSHFPFCATIRRSGGAIKPPLDRRTPRLQAAAMLRPALTAAFALLLVAAVPAPAPPLAGTVEREATALDALIPRDAKVERIAEGYTWSEGPVWIADGAYLLFSDVPEN